MPNAGRIAGACLLVLASLVPPLAAQTRVYADGFEPLPTFVIDTPQATVAAGAVATVCYYFLSPNPATVGVRRWSSQLDAGVQHILVYATYDGSWNPIERQPAGTLEYGCGLNSGSTTSGWIYAAHSQAAEMALPGDGAGRPLALELLPGQPLVLQMRIINASGAQIAAGATLMAESLQPGNPYTKTATYRTENTSLAIPAGSTVAQQNTCPVPADVKFWRLTMRTHARGTLMRMLDGGVQLLTGSDWEDPPVAEPPGPTFQVFANGGLTAECTYQNDSGSPVTFGESEDSDEVCAGIGYFFPANRPSLCFNNVGPL